MSVVSERNKLYKKKKNGTKLSSKNFKLDKELLKVINNDESLRNNMEYQLNYIQLILLNTLQQFM